MMTLSLCMIVKNEEKVIRRCLESVKEVCDEMIVVDTGSQDNTREIAAACGAKVFSFPWTYDFAAARNYSFSLASSDYLLWLDADDVILPKEQKKLRCLKAGLTDQVDVVMARYATAFDEEDRPVFFYYRERIVKNDGRFFWQGRVHEAIVPEGNVFYADLCICHKKTKPSDADRNLRIYEDMLKSRETLGPREQFYYGRELYYHGKWQEASRAFETFLTQEEGFLENRIDACRLLTSCRRNLGDMKGAYEALFSSFCYDTPRAETCCDLGAMFFNANLLEQSVYWYGRALEAGKKERSGGFIEEDCYGYLPSIGLCMCHDRLGNHRKAFYYNEKAATYKPKDRYVALNRKYFREKWGM